MSAASQGSQLGLSYNALHGLSSVVTMVRDPQPEPDESDDEMDDIGGFRSSAPPVQFGL